MNYKLLLLSSLLVLAGCVTVDKPYPVRHKIECPDPVKSKPIHPKPIHPTVISDVNGNWWIALSSEYYKNLAGNTDETIRYIKDQKGVIVYYRQCIIDFNENIDKLENN
jgi:hypothetical protein